MQVSGEFVPGAAHALERIGAAVTGLPASADAAAITASIQAALGGEAVSAGICPGSVPSRAPRRPQGQRQARP